MAAPSLPIRPGQSLGFMHLGASLHEICTALRADQKTYRRLELVYSAQDPLQVPVVINLPDNGIRLRFDAPDQRLRLIEVMDFHAMNFTYKNEDLLPSQHHDGSLGSTPAKVQSSLMYRRVYQLFGPSYPGEFVPPVDKSDKSDMGTYVLSFPGVALSFPLHVSAWSPKVDHATMLSSSVAPVTSIAIFDGPSWPEARDQLFLREPSAPRSSKPSTDEIEHITIYGAGRIEMARRTSSPFHLILSQSTPQDLITELGPPDAIFARQRPDGANDSPSQRPAAGRTRRMSAIPGMPRSYGSAASGTPSSVSSTNTDTYETDFDDEDPVELPSSGPAKEEYYCYYSHGFDILIGPAQDISPLPPSHPEAQKVLEDERPMANEARSVATRIVLHGNVPGSYAFNRHRRSRWSLDFISDSTITSEAKFPSYHDRLVTAYKSIWPAPAMSEGMVIVRSWNGDEDESPSGSAIWIGGEMDDDFEALDADDAEWEGIGRGTAAAEMGMGKGGMGSNGPGGDGSDEKWLRNTKLFKFPGLMFEVMHNGIVSAVTVY